MVTDLFEGLMAVPTPIFDGDKERSFGSPFYLLTNGPGSLRQEWGKVSVVGAPFEISLGPGGWDFGAGH